MLILKTHESPITALLVAKVFGSTSIHYSAKSAEEPPSVMLVSAQHPNTVRGQTFLTTGALNDFLKLADIPGTSVYEADEVELFLVDALAILQPQLHHLDRLLLVAKAATGLLEQLVGLVKEQEVGHKTMPLDTLDYHLDQIFNTPAKDVTKAPKQAKSKKLVKPATRKVRISKHHPASLKDGWTEA